MSLVLGTAQWGGPYGVTNERGRLTDADVQELVRIAKDCGIADVDTARGYGDSELRLRAFAQEFSVTTKVRGGSDVGKQIEDSLDRLGLESVTSVLIHDWEDLDADGRAATVGGLRASLDSGLTDLIGVSIYTEMGVESAVEDFAAVELGALQVPANALDRRLDGSVLLEELAAAGAQITVRSAFLQGVLLADQHQRAAHPDVRAFVEWVRDDESQASLLEACLAHVRSLSWATHVVVGATSAAELVEICAAWRICGVERAPLELASTDLELIDPRRW